MNNTEKGAYAQAMRKLAELKDRPHILKNCTLDIIIPGDDSAYSQSFITGRGENRFTITTNQKGEATNMNQTHKSPSEERAIGKRLLPFLIIFIVATVASIVITGVATTLKSNPMKARLDGVLHARMSLADHKYDPYYDPRFPEDGFPRGKLY